MGLGHFRQDEALKLQKEQRDEALGLLDEERLGRLELLSLVPVVQVGVGPPRLEDGTSPTCSDSQKPTCKIFGNGGLTPAWPGAPGAAPCRPPSTF